MCFMKCRHNLLVPLSAEISYSGCLICTLQLPDLLWSRLYASMCSACDAELAYGDFLLQSELAFWGGFFQWTYGLDSADLASMKVVLAGKGIFLGPNVLFWLLWFWERGRSCTWCIQFNIILTGLSVEFVADLRCQTATVLESYDSFLFAFWVRQSTFLVRQSIAISRSKHFY